MFARCGSLSAGTRNAKEDSWRQGKKERARERDRERKRKKNNEVEGGMEVRQKWESRKQEMRR